MPDAPRRKIVPLLEHDILGPNLKDLALNPSMLDFAEMIMDPYVQLDSYEISGFPIRDASHKGGSDRWHRDSFHLADCYTAHYERAGRNHEVKRYTPPLACNCLIYLQDINEETGPFRMAPGSHLNSKIIAQSQVYEQHPEQKFLDLKAGDLVILHHEVLHTGTWNTSDQYRYLISNFVCCIAIRSISR
jgi:ectoine hydroxylase-related dioxygenase (phytanoyl-CoA dioxygenase family)